MLISAESEVSIGGAVTATDHVLQLVDMPVPSKRRPKSQYGGRTVFNLITLFYLKYKETTLALGLTSVTVITWKSIENLPLDCLRTCGK